MYIQLHACMHAYIRICRSIKHASMHAPRAMYNHVHACMHACNCNFYQGIHGFHTLSKLTLIFSGALNTRHTNRCSHAGVHVAM